MAIPVLDEALVFLDGYVDRVEGSVLHAELANFFEYRFRVLVEGRRVADQHDDFLGRRRPSHPIDRGPHCAERVLLPFAAVVRLNVIEEVDELVGRDGHLHGLDGFAAAAEHHDADAGGRDEAVDGENQLLHLGFDVVDDEAHRTGAVDHNRDLEAAAAQAADEAAETRADSASDLRTSCFILALTSLMMRLIEPVPSITIVTSRPLRRRPPMKPPKPAPIPRPI